MDNIINLHEKNTRLALEQELIRLWIKNTPGIGEEGIRSYKRTTSELDIEDLRWELEVEQIIEGRKRNYEK